MIFVTGDCHSDFHRFSKNVFPEQKRMTKEDTVIICGDFGGVWYQEGYPAYEDELRSENYWLDWLEKRPFTVVFVDGNHENHNRLSHAFPVKKWCGGRVHEIRPHVFHLMRGEVYEIEGQKVFAFGGASSHDISDGIIDSSDKDWKKQCRRLELRGRRMYRVKGISWWPEELPSEEEMDNGRKNLELHNWNVDYVITHCCASSTQAFFSRGIYQTDVLTDYLEEIRAKLKFRKWFFGHYHDNRNISMREIMLYEQIIRIS